MFLFVADILQSILLDIFISKEENPWTILQVR